MELFSLRYMVKCVQIHIVDFTYQWGPPLGLKAKERPHKPLEHLLLTSFCNNKVGQDVIWSSWLQEIIHQVGFLASVKEH